MKPDGMRVKTATADVTAATMSDLFHRHDLITCRSDVEHHAKLRLAMADMNVIPKRSVWRLEANHFLAKIVADLANKKPTHAVKTVARRLTTTSTVCG